jgi:hypothetical protein
MLGGRGAVLHAEAGQGISNYVVIQRVGSGGRGRGDLPAENVPVCPGHSGGDRSTDGAHNAGGDN